METFNEGRMVKAAILKFPANGRIRESGLNLADDATHVLGKETVRIAIAQFTRLYEFDKNDLETMRRAVEVEALPDSWRQFFRNRIQTISQQRNGM